MFRTGRPPAPLEQATLPPRLRTRQCLCVGVRAASFDAVLSHGVACIRGCWVRAAPCANHVTAVTEQASGEPVPDSRISPSTANSSPRRVLLFCVAAAALSGFGTAVGQEYCSEPVAPYCVDTDSEFDSLLQVNRCQDDLADYQQQVNEYESCITSQIEGMRKALSEARTKLEQAEKEF